jgi:hypothetical protein
MRVLVCGGRDFDGRDLVFKTLDEMLIPPGEMLPPAATIIHGASPSGADRWADEWAVVNWTGLAEYPADWSAHGKAAGPIRNQRMIDEGRPDVVVAFPGGRGTADMVRRARAAGVRVVVVET